MSRFLALLAVAAVLALGGCGERGGKAERGGSFEPGPEWEHPGGRWHPVNHTSLTDEQHDEIVALRSIGYLAGSRKPPEDVGITAYDTTRAYRGLNFFTSGDSPSATLMDMNGNLLHRWSYRFIDAWETGPREELPQSAKGAGFWRRAYLFDNGDVLAIYDGLGLIKVDKNSKLIWAYLEGAHHDLDVLPDGRIFTLIREAGIDRMVNPDHAVLEDYIAILDADGHELRRIPLLDAFRETRFSKYLEGMKTEGDIFHTNTIEVLRGAQAGHTPGFEAGNVLVCIRELDVVAVVDPDTGKVVWAARAPWSKPHQATVLPDGNVMIFDNRGYGGVSRVVEFVPSTLEIVWEYHGADPLDFYSKECGSNQRLLNGDTLITETDGGRAFEVTPAGKIVWEYVNPAHAGDHNEFVASIFDMVRLDPDFPTGWLHGG
jgi:outer membrane protein assembly factor BamB